MVVTASVVPTTRVYIMWPQEARFIGPCRIRVKYNELTQSQFAMECWDYFHRGRNEKLSSPEEHSHISGLYPAGCLQFQLQSFCRLSRFGPINSLRGRTYPLIKRSGKITLKITLLPPIKLIVMNNMLAPKLDHRQASDRSVGVITLATRIESHSM